LRVQNPNKQALDIAGISYSIALLDREVITGVTNDVPLIAPYSEEVVTLEAGFNLVQLLRLLTGMGRTTGEALDYLLSVLDGMVRRTPANLVALRESIAEKLVEAGFTEVYNVLEGFEGELDDNHHRSSIGGWRHHGLPWAQC